MKLKLLSCLLILLLALPALALPPKGNFSNPTALSTDNTTAIDVNRIYMFVTNHGNFGRDLSGVFGYDYGTWYPYAGDPEAIDQNINGAGDQTPNYASGLWIGGVINGTDTVVAISEYDSEYGPGPMLNGTFQPDIPDFRVFKLYADSLKTNPNQDYLDYMSIAAVSQGAPTVVDGDGDTVPDMVGDQMLWAVYNDADPLGHINMNTEALGIEVKQTVFGFNREDPLGDIVFVKYQIFNNGNNIIDDFYISLWSDPDLGSSGDDLVGCDTTLGLGYVYNISNNDSQYGSRPPAMGFDFFQGPLVGKTDPDQPDGRMWGQTYTDSTNLGMVSFNKYINGTDPDTYAEVYMYQNGLDAKAAAPYSYNGVDLMYYHSGDPVTGAGDIDLVGADKRWMQTTGPLTFVPGDSTEILAAIVLGQGGDRKSSISVMKYNDQFAQGAYDINFDVASPPASPVVSYEALRNEVSLSWGGDSETDPGDYGFQGYTVYQGDISSGTLEWTRIANYDIADGEALILDKVLDPLTGALETRGVKFGSDNGIKRYFIVNEDYINGGELNNLSTYYFKVEAYSLAADPDAKPRTLTSSSPIIKLEPQAPVAGTEVNAETEEALDVTHVAGGSQGVITPIVVDPMALTGDTYRVIFVDTIGIVVDTVILDPIAHPEDTTFNSTDVAWHLENATTGQRILSYQTNQTNDDDYFAVDGVYVKVAGPPPGFISFQVVANGAGVVDPPESAGAPWYGYPVPHDVDPDGYVTDGQQVGDGHWMIATGDNGGTSGGGSRGSYATFLTRTLRDDPNRIANLGAYDWEIRFTGDNANPGVGGSMCWEWATDQSSYWVPFEVWRVGIGTLNDPSDDVRFYPYIFGDGNQVFDLSSYGSALDGNCGPGGCEHSISGADNDPYTGDWLYIKQPADLTPGSAGYDAFEQSMLTDPVNHVDDADNVIGRLVFVNWNGGDQPPFNQDMPEQGTVFRMLTAKPNAPTDTFTFSTAAYMPTYSQSEDLLDAITPVPNPFYLKDAYDASPGSYSIKFHNLPDVCTISIYNLAGTMVKTIVKDDASANNISWDVLTDNGLPVASGIYIYVVDAPGFGQKIGKMAVFVEEEVLRIY